MLVPELPQSSGSLGALNSPSGSSPTVISSPSLAIGAPRAARACAVAATSAPEESPRIRCSPVLSEEKISARCEIDLSPGTASSPENRRAGTTFVRPSNSGCWERMDMAQVSLGERTATRRLKPRPTNGNDRSDPGGERRGTVRRVQRGDVREWTVPTP